MGRVSRYWDTYDRLIGAIPADLTVQSYLVGSTWTLVEAGGVGMAMTYRGGSFNQRTQPSFAGRPLKDMAEKVRDWHLPTASLGMAAVNAYHNRADVVSGWVNKPLEKLVSPGDFVAMLPEMAGKKVAVIGHFPGLETVAEVADLTIIERNPVEGDLPDFASEYVLPDQDFVLITGTTITNKTLPRLIEICEKPYVAIVGPSLAFAPWWFEYGVDLLAGAVIVDKDLVWKGCAEGAHRQIFDQGATMINIRRGDLA